MILLAILVVRMLLFICTVLVAFLAATMILYLKKWHHVERALLAMLMIVSWWCINSVIYITLKKVETEYVAARR